MPRVLDLLPDGASIDGGSLVVGGVPATDLASRFGTPLVVYDETTLRNQARAYRAAAPDALVVYGTKAFPSVAVLQLFAEEGLGADVSTAGELAFALRAGLDGQRLVVHGNNKEDELLRGPRRRARSSYSTHWRSWNVHAPRASGASWSASRRGSRPTRTRR